MSDNTKDTEQENTWGPIKIILGLAVMFYFGPALIILAINFLKLVVFGDVKMSEFNQHMFELSLARVNMFYDWLWYWIESLFKRLQS